jgi:hypothetical protein
LFFLGEFSKNKKDKRKRVNLKNLTNKGKKKIKNIFKYDNENT